jgi:hypothetical protein
VNSEVGDIEDEDFKMGGSKIKYSYKAADSILDQLGKRSVLE